MAMWMTSATPSAQRDAPWVPLARAMSHETRSYSRRTQHRMVRTPQAAGGTKLPPRRGGPASARYEQRLPAPSSPPARAARTGGIFPYRCPSTCVPGPRPPRRRLFTAAFPRVFGRGRQRGFTPPCFWIIKPGGPRRGGADGSFGRGRR